MLTSSSAPEAEHVRRFHEVCQSAEVAFARQQRWGAEGEEQLAASLARLIQVLLKSVLSSSGICVQTGALSSVQAQTPSEEHWEVRQGVLKRVDSLVRAGLAGYKGMWAEAYGSFVSGLFTPTGDLDIAIEGLRTRGCAFSSQ